MTFGVYDLRRHEHALARPRDIELLCVTRTTSFSLLLSSPASYSIGSDQGLVLEPSAFVLLYGN